MYNGQDLLDFSFPTAQLTAFDDDEFLAMLQRHAKPLQVNAGAVPSASATANPADINALPPPTLISPPTSDSSPSPPNSEGPSSSQTQLAPPTAWPLPTPMPSTTRATRGAAANVKDTSDVLGKRKAVYDEDDDDDDEDAPQRKVQHTEQNANTKKTASKRKSTGTTQDESRLLKRKEQNRAAQRAFRERKEKHVKDLEDKVSMLEAKTDSQAAENENLRELLTRLQQENLQLKQNQFSFSFTQPVPSTSSGPVITPPSAQNAQNSNTQSPTSLLGNQPTPPTLANRSTPEISFLDSLSMGMDTGMPHGFGFTPPSFGPPETTSGGLFTMLGGNSPTQQQSNSLQSFNPTPYQTIASNPMFTSFRDPVPNAWSFGATTNGTQDVSLSTYDELFGGGGGGNAPISSISSAPDTNMDDLLSFSTSFLPDFSNSAASTSNSISPISHHGVSPQEQTNAPSGSANGTVNTSPTTDALENMEHTDCPKSKSDLEKIIQSSSMQTMGPPVDEKELTEACLLAEAGKVNLDLGTAWRAVRQHPQFEDCDIDQLCADLKKKARCDGNGKVVEAEQIMNIVHSIPDRAQQRKLSLAGK